MSVQAIAVRGPFTADDVAELAAVLRRIDSRNPTATFEFYALDPNESVFESKRLMAEILPEMPHRQTETPDDPLRHFGLGRNAGLSEAADVLTVSASTIRLHAGEMTAGEMRSVRAVLGWMQREIHQRMGKSAPRFSIRRNVQDHAEAIERDGYTVLLLATGAERNEQEVEGMVARLNGEWITSDDH